MCGSLSTRAQQTCSSNSHLIKAVSENVSVTIAPTLTFAEQELSDFLVTILANYAQSKTCAWQQRIINSSPSILKSIKTYIIFRALRN